MQESGGGCLDVRWVDDPNVKLTEGIWEGAVAGAAGTTALNAATYIDMVVRGRASSSAPEETVEKLAERTSVRIPGDQETRQSRVSGLGALNGIASGFAVGAVIGAVRSAGWRPRTLSTGMIAALAAMGLTNGVMTVLDVTDLRTWSATDWASDVLPHLAYGFVTAAALEAFDGPMVR